jgi:predicted nucleic acid-binding protein
MSRIYWDTMLFVYWLEDGGARAARVQTILDAMGERGDTLSTSVFTLGETLTGAYKRGDQALAEKIRDLLRPPFVEMLPFDAAAADRYARIRAGGKVAAADAVHLACAAEAGVDLFLTNDKRLQRIRVEGVGFVASMDAELF